MILIEMTKTRKRDTFYESVLLAGHLFFWRIFRLLHITACSLQGPLEHLIAEREQLKTRFVAIRFNG
ncbi:hypothetical protein PAECIP111893_00145 [Paenibacillus plantiphilus]|uniref:Uncharacterized protein n=1 Tax=Paenibacillus plantiphilus TaxID=2905650 RepID=A0ABM9BLY8_9BACL|nr:hypothetical protein PAECIP111893_00145 [Paenibacillus plantiphilus]